MKLKVRLYEVGFLVLSLLLVVIIVSPLQGETEPFSFSWSHITSESSIGIDWSPTGSLLVSGLYDTSEIIALSWQSGEIKQRVSFPNQSGRMDLNFSAQWSPNGHSIATFDGAGNLYILDPENGELNIIQESRDEYGYFAVTWSSDSSAMAALRNDGYIHIISLKVGEIVQAIDVAGDDGLRGEGLLYYVFDWSPNGNLFAAPHQMSVLSGGQPVMGFWDRYGNLVDTYTQESLTDSTPQSLCSPNAFLLQYTHDVQWANDSRTLAASGGDGYGVCRLNIDGTIDEHIISDLSQDTLRWSPDQQWLVASHRNAGECTIQLSATAQNYQTYPIRIDTQNCSVRDLAWSPDSQHLAASTDRGLWVGTLVTP